MQKSISEMSTQEIIGAAISKVREGQNTRESSLVITKLEEAMMWQNAYEVALKDAARRAGVGPSVRSPHAQMLGGVMLTEPIDLPPTQPPAGAES